MSFDFPFVRLFGGRQFCYYPYSLFGTIQISLKCSLIVEKWDSNCENRNDPDLVQAFLKKWWAESDFKAPNLPNDNAETGLVWC
jgi:hypothetical protein